ncbi:hypothetical protein ACE4Z5_26975, partial [Salmonella enterica]|uniref:hypothetical protein n=1 Tax=Salmonella enterica TaxID=28901 RepID=UPI003D2A9A69
TRCCARAPGDVVGDKPAPAIAPQNVSRTSENGLDRRRGAGRARQLARSRAACRSVIGCE